MQLKLSAAISAALLFSFNIHSDDHGMPAPTLIPLETLQCNFNGNKDVEDLYKIQDEWSTFVEENEDVSYASWLVTPMFRSASDFTNDIGWLGVSPNWTAFGKAYDAWFDRAGKIAEKFDKVYTCDSQQLFAAQIVRQTENTSSNGVMMVSHCSLINSATLMDVTMADQKWNAYLDSQGSEGTIVKWYPGPGTPTDLDYSFKYVNLAPSMESWGQSSESFVNAGGLIKQQEIFGDLLSCDSARIYRISAYGGQQ